MNKVNDNATAENINSKRRNCNNLCNIICLDENASSFSAVNEIGSFFELASHMVEIAEA